MGEQQTLTMCLQDRPFGEVKLTWKDRKMGSIILQVILTGPCWHWQSPLMQLFLEHMVDFQHSLMDRKREGNWTKQIMVSFHPVNNPQVDPKWYEQRLRLDARTYGQ